MKQLIMGRWVRVSGKLWALYAGDKVAQVTLKSGGWQFVIVSRQEVLLTSTKLYHRSRSARRKAQWLLARL